VVATGHKLVRCREVGDLPGIADTFAPIRVTGMESEVLDHSFVGRHEGCPPDDRAVRPIARVGNPAFTIREIVSERSHPRGVSTVHLSRIGWVRRSGASGTRRLKRCLNRDVGS